MSGPDPAGFSNPDGARTAEQLAYQQGQRDMLRKLTTPRMTVFRGICGVIWGVIAIVFAGGAIYNIAHHAWGEVAAGLVIAILAGWYDYRIWTLKARRLWLII
jgi:hypothetical protein